MVNPNAVVFPITGEQLVELQRTEVCRDLTAAEVEFFNEVASMANDAYEAATRGDAETVQSILSAVNSIPVLDTYTRHLAALCRGWVLLGGQKGTTQLKAAINGLS